MNWITMFKSLLKPGLLIAILIILFLYNYTGIGIIIIVIYFIDNFHQLNYYWKKENDDNEFIKSIDNGISDNVLNKLLCHTNSPSSFIKANG